MKKIEGYLTALRAVQHKAIGLGSKSWDDSGDACGGWRRQQPGESRDEDVGVRVTRTTRQDGEK